MFPIYALFEWKNIISASSYEIKLDENNPPTTTILTSDDSKKKENNNLIQASGTEVTYSYTRTTPLVEGTTYYVTVTAYDNVPLASYVFIYNNY